MKKFILNADDFGKSEYNNIAVFEGLKHGLLTSASLMTNMEGSASAIDFIKKNPNYRFGIHLNIIEGKALNPNLKTLCGDNGYFNNSFLTLLAKSNSKKFLKEIEIEFRSQIETMAQSAVISHIDSHVHTHSIPNIFKIAKKLAEEYKIPYIRTQNEIPYYIKETDCKKYLINQIKVLLLSCFSNINKKSLKNSNLITNDYLIGVSYTGMMNSLSVIEGLKKIKGDNLLVEALIHPCVYSDNRVDSHSREYKIIENIDLSKKITELGFKMQEKCEVLHGV